MDTEAEKAYLWLCACTELDDKTRVSVLREAHDPAALFEGFPVPAAEGRDRRGEAEKFLSALEKKGYFALTLLSRDYPENLKNIPDPPLVLYGAGRRELLEGRRFCIVGSRNTPAWAEACGKRASEEIAERFTVVTGLAEGGDSAAIAGALPSGNLISVLPCGLDRCYPAAHASLKAKIAERGLLLSEYAPATGAAKYAFYARNRILAGLSDGVLVVSAGEKSGALITANRAAEYGRDVFAFPYNIGAAQGAGCNELIKRGAFLATSAADILSAYGFEKEEKKEAQFTPEEEKILKTLREKGEMHLAAIADAAGMRVFEATAVLSALELKGAAVKAGGNRYSAL